jgi:hypothetical protein
MSAKYFAFNKATQQWETQGKGFVMFMDVRYPDHNSRPVLSYMCSTACRTDVYCRSRRMEQEINQFSWDDCSTCGSMCRFDLHVMLVGVARRFRLFASDLGPQRNHISAGSSGMGLISP